MEKHKNDIILFVCLLAVALIAYFAFTQARTEGATVLVTVDGEKIAEYPLSENTEIRIGDSDCGNTLVIKDGKAHIKNASCPDKICERNEIHYNGESIVCLPNKTVISVKSADEAPHDF